MASRRDELNAYTFAKRRMLAAFVRPSPTGSEEDAPRPLRAVVPGVIVSLVVLAAFGAWGMFKPSAPPGWDTPGEKVIIASKSTTRYVVLKTDGKTQLHPVLNMASAKLLLDADKGEVINVDESVLDSGKIPHGATIGIPYAPDRLPAPGEAGEHKLWAVCEQPGQGGDAIQKAAFVFADRDVKRTEGAGRLRGGDLLYVQGPDKQRYVVDLRGTAYPVDDDEGLLRALVGLGRQPEQVSAEWLATLHSGDKITFPRVHGEISANAHVPGDLPPEANRVGMILETPDVNTTRHFVVLPGKVAPISDFTARLLLNSGELNPLSQAGKPFAVGPATFRPETKEFTGEPRDWPSEEPRPVNEAGTTPESHNTVCNVLHSVDGKDGSMKLSTWIGKDFPATLPVGSSSAYVTPGSGQLFRQFQGTDTKAGPVFLVTDTGLRYAMQYNSDSTADDSRIGLTEKQRKEEQKEAERAKVLLGYKDVTPAPIPVAWSEFLPTGPRLSTTAARQPQGS